MKLTLSLLLALSAAEPAVKINRKVPPRHPRNRLARLNMFCDYLFTKTGWIKENRSKGLIRLCNTWSAKMEDKVSNSKCFFYDPEAKPHGGPDKNAVIEPPREYHENWDTGLIDWNPQNRRRRSDCPSGTLANPIEEDADDMPCVQTTDPSQNNYMDPGWFDAEEMALVEAEELDTCLDDCEDNGCTQEQKDSCLINERGSGEKKIKRLIKNGPWKGSRSILTGFRKFGERYLSQCHGHRKGTHMNKRTQFIVRVTRKFLTHCDHAECSQSFLDTNRFKWGKKNLRTDHAGK